MKRIHLFTLTLLLACADRTVSDVDEPSAETGETGDDQSLWPDYGERCDNQPYPCQPPYGCKASGEFEEDGSVIGICGWPDGQGPDHTLKP